MRHVLPAVALACLVRAASGAPAFESPFQVYADFGDPKNHGTPSGWMGDFRDLSMEAAWTNRPRSGRTCMRFAYTAEGTRYADMAGVLWQYPANNSGDVDGRLDLRGAQKLIFWARGEQGGEMIASFLFGGALGAYPDSDKAAIYEIRLNPEWTRYEIDLSACDLRHISCFFGWVAGRFANQAGMVFYVDDIWIE